MAQEVGLEVLEAVVTGDLGLRGTGGGTHLPMEGRFPPAVADPMVALWTNRSGFPSEPALKT